MRNDGKYGLLQVIIQGKIEGKRGTGTRRISLLANLHKWFGATSTEHCLDDGQPPQRIGHLEKMMLSS